MGLRAPADGPMPVPSCSCSREEDCVRFSMHAGLFFYWRPPESYHFPMILVVHAKDSRVFLVEILVPSLLRSVAPPSPRISTVIGYASRGAFGE